MKLPIAALYAFISNPLAIKSPAPKPTIHARHTTDKEDVLRLLETAKIDTSYRNENKSAPLKAKL